MLEGERISVAVSTGSGSMAVSIHDTYIPKDCIANLSHPFRCHPFRRMENVLSRRHQGSGMGLLRIAPLATPTTIGAMARPRYAFG